MDAMREHPRVSAASVLLVSFSCRESRGDAVPPPPPQQQQLLIPPEAPVRVIVSSASVKKGCDDGTARLLS